MSDERRVLVLGLDGTTFNVIDPLVRRGLLPNLGKLGQVGTKGRLMSTIPPTTAPAWTSAFTGVNPGNHGIFDFFKMNGVYERHVNTCKNRSSRAIWNLLSDSGVPVILVNVPMTFPPEILKNGIMVSGIHADVSKEFTSPPELKKELLPMKYMVDLDYIRLRVKSRDDYIKQIVAMTDARYNVTEYLMTKYPWRLTIVVFVGPDRVQHYFWDDQEVIERVYTKLDEVAGKFMRRLKYETDTLLVMSDHGFGPGMKTLYVNKYFLDNSMLRLRNPSFTKQLLKRAGMNQNSLSKIGLNRLWLSVSKTLNLSDSKLTDFLRTNLVTEESLSDVDWSRTTCWFSGTASVRINQRGREPSGIVGEKEYEQTRARIKATLLSLRDPKTGSPLLSNVLKREEVYHGSEVSRSADLILVPSEGLMLEEPIVNTNFLADGEIVNGLNGDHRPDGIFYLYGSAAAENRLLENNPNIVDVAPTILHILGQAVPTYMDGRIIKEALTSELEIKASLTTDLGSGRQVAGSATVQLGSEEEEEIIERLKRMGYV